MIIFLSIVAEPAVTSKAELRKAMIMYNLQTDSLKAKLQDKIESCRSHREDQATEELEKAMELLVSRQSRMNQILVKVFPLPFKNNYYKEQIKS